MKIKVVNLAMRMFFMMAVSFMAKPRRVREVEREVGAGEPELPAAEAVDGDGGHGESADGGSHSDVGADPWHCLVEFVFFLNIVSHGLGFCCVGFEFFGR